jgi:sensor histidine kinase regulating citrate/malate metabolism
MDKIYSRRKIYIKNLRIDKKILRLIISILIFFAVFIIIFNLIYPIFEGKCAKKAMEIATTITNESASDVLKNVSYSEIVTIDEAAARKR